MSRFSTHLLTVLAAITATAVAASPAAGRQVVLVVWDGMRPDFVNEVTTPNLWALARDGVFFANHHPVYPSATEVNGTAIATGAYPGHSTIIGNKEYRAAIDPTALVNTEKPEVILRDDAASGGHYLAVDTLAEYLHVLGLPTAIAGAKQVALLADRAPRPDGASSSPIVFEGHAFPAGLEAKLTATLGAFPPEGKNASGQENKLARDAWTTRALLEVLWKDRVPPFSQLWLAEPDRSQHSTGPGSPDSLAAIRSSDRNLGLVLAELDRRGLRANTDVMVVSDHGFSTVGRVVDVAAELSAAGFNAARTVPGGLQPGQVLVVSNGGTVFLYVGGHDADLSRRLAYWAQTRDWAGVVFARMPVEGTFALATVHLDSPEAPDVAVAFRWSLDTSANGTSGVIGWDGTERRTQGQHASLSATDMHNTLVACGPDFRAGLRDTLPSGNTDVTPTILWILGFKDEAKRRDGRVLAEALAGPPELRNIDVFGQNLTARRDLGNGQVWEQYLNAKSCMGGPQYFDEGNGAQVPADETGKRRPETGK